jgi:preprotein translocase subunit YajC
MNMGFIAILVLLFYILMIRPQQKRMKSHTAMLSTLDKGTNIVTQGGLVGTVDKIIDDNKMRINVDGTMLLILRSSIMAKYDEAVPASSSANDDKQAKKKNTKK